MTPAQIQLITGEAKWHEPLEAVFVGYEINTPRRQAVFLANCAHESQGFTRLIENMNYSAKRLRQVFPKYFKTDAEAEEYVSYGPAWIAEHVYGGRMGNGPEGSGDGWRFIARGLIGITGRDNYRRCGIALGADLTENPQWLELPDWAAVSAGWYWHTHGLNTMADVGDLEGVTRAINGGLNGHDDRLRRFAEIEGLMNAMA